MNGELELSPSSTGPQVVFRGRALYSSDPVAGANARAGRVRPPPDSIILWYSPVLWHGIDALLRETPESCWIVGIESEPALLELSRKHLPHTGHRVSLLATTDVEVASVLTEIEQSRYRRVLELTTSAGALLHRPVYRSVRDLLDRQIQIVWQNRLTLNAMGKLWIRNITLNLPGLVNAATVERSSRPVVVAGAGPSLDRAIPFLLEVREALTIIAVDTALPVLASHEIIPDLVVAVEAQLVNAYDFLPCASRDYTLIADLGSTPAALALHSRHAWMLSRHSGSAILDRLATLPGIHEVLPPLGSVGVTAVRLAMELSTQPLFLTGLDFAVIPGQTHARGAPSMQWQHIHGTRLRPVGDYTLHINRIHAPSATGRPCETTLVLAGYAKELARTLGTRAAFQIEPIGPPVGAAPLSGSQAAKEILALSQGAPRASGGASATSSAEPAALEEFVENEIKMLEEFLSDRPPQQTVSACDYLFDIAAYTGPASGANRIPTVRILASYFRERWHVTKSLISLRRS